MLPIPTAWWLRPVSSACRVGAHSAVVWNRLYFSPPAASRSAVGRLARPTERAGRTEADVVQQHDQHVRRPVRRQQRLDQRGRRVRVLRVVRRETRAQVGQDRSMLRECRSVLIGRSLVRCRRPARVTSSDTAGTARPFRSPGDSHRDHGQTARLIGASTSTSDGIRPSASSPSGAACSATGCSSRRRTAPRRTAPRSGRGCWSAGCPGGPRRPMSRRPRRGFRPRLAAATSYSSMANGVGGASGFDERFGRDPRLERREELVAEPLLDEVRDLLLAAAVRVRPRDERGDIDLRSAPATSPSARAASIRIALVRPQPRPARRSSASPGAAPGRAEGRDDEQHGHHQPPARSGRRSPPGQRLCHARHRVGHRRCRPSAAWASISRGSAPSPSAAAGRLRRRAGWSKKARSIRSSVITTVTLPISTPCVTAPPPGRRRTACRRR